MNDSTDIDVHDEDRATEESKASISGRVAALVVLLILLLLGCGLFWPVPEAERIVDEPAEPDRVHGRAGALELERVDVGLAEGVAVTNKGVAVVVNMDLRSDETRIFEPGWARLQIHKTLLPPLSEPREGLSRWSSYPATLEADRAVSVSLVYAVPRESRETTLVIQPGDLPPLEAIEVRLDLPGGP